MRIASFIRVLAISPALAWAAALPAPAAAATTGGVDASRPLPPATVPPTVTGGTRYGARAPRAARGRRAARGPIATEFGVSPGAGYAFGSPVRVRFRIDRGSRTVRAALLVRRLGDGQVVQRIDLGQQPTGRRLWYRWRVGALRDGAYALRLEARDQHGRGLRSGGRASVSATVDVHGERFPLAGPHDFGDALDRYGAPRAGHRHAGQDILAPEGTPLVAARGGTVLATGYSGGAGYYVAIHGAGGTRDYFYAHIRKGTIAVSDGQAVRTGQHIGDVGHTGDAVGSHLHFEIWEGPWWAGGHTIDPLPDLKRWDAWS